MTTEKLEWAARNLRAIADRGRGQLGDAYPEIVLVLATIRGLAAESRKRPSLDTRETNATMIYGALYDHARQRTSRENIEDVLAALASRQEAPVASAQGSPELLLGWKRYEKARKLSPFQWNRLHIRNLAGENFDAMIDSLPEPTTPVPIPSEALSPATVAQPVGDWKLEALRTATPYCISCEREGHWTHQCHSTHGFNTPRDMEMARLSWIAAGYIPAQPCASQGCGGAELCQAAEEAIQWLNSWFRNHDGNKVADKLRTALSKKIIS